MVFVESGSVPVETTSRRVLPWWRDRGVVWSLVLLGLLTAFNLWQDDASRMLIGTGIAVPLLAAVLAMRARRVVAVGLLTVVVMLATWEYKGLPDDAAHMIRIISLVVATGVATWATQARLRARQHSLGVAEVSRAVQAAVMGLEAPVVEQGTIALRYRAADVDALIGGDALEAIPTPWGTRVLVADARGKGLNALLASTSVLAAFREWGPREASLPQLLVRLNDSLDRQLEGEDFVTALVGQFDGVDFSYVSAGHPPPLLVREREARELLLDARFTTPLAMDVPHPPAEEGRTRLMAGDVVLMLTDGIIEARDPSGAYFPAELAAGAAFADADLDCGIDALFAAASAHAGAAGLTDDIAVAAIRIDDGHLARW